MTAWVRKPEPHAITSERYLTYSGHDYSPAVSPDGKLIAFTSTRDGLQRIWLKQVSGGSEVRSGNLDLWLTGTDGGSVRRITDDTAEDWDPAFTPDGKKIVWSSGRTGNLEIWIANADGQDFVPGIDTAQSRRPLGGFDHERATESFGISADGKLLTVAGWEQLFSLFSVEGVPYLTSRRNDKKENS